MPEARRRDTGARLRRKTCRGSAMALLNFDSAGEYRGFDERACRAAGGALTDIYRGAFPFPHIAIDDFLPGDVLRDVAEGFPDRSDHSAFARTQERLKYQFHPQDCDSPAIRHLFAELNSQAFLGFLGELTGIAGLIPDPYFSGAGLHETMPGGHLGIHADFNRHQTMKLERRLNLLIYLNEGWEERYGGALELWDRQMQACQVRVLPVLGRAVVFNTDLDSHHGHPEPLTCPLDRSRRSIATYYYTAPERDDFDVVRETKFRVRPNSEDRRDWKVILHHLAQDWTPPALRRA